MSTAVRAPRQPRRRRDDAARERGPARHRPRALHRRPGLPHQRRAARPPGAGAARPRADHPRSTRAPAYDVPGVVRVLTAARRARRQRRRHQARRAAVPRRGHVLRPRGLLGARRDPRGRPARRRGGRGRLRAAARDPDRRRGDRGRELPGHAAGAGARRRRRRPGPGGARLRGRDRRSPGRSTSTSRRTARWRMVDENGQVFVQSSTQHPTETQEIVAHVLGAAQQRGDRAVPADGRRLRRQGDAAARARRGRRARRDPHRAPGPAAADPHRRT